MAKKQAESGPGTFMILALVFFVLTSAVLGVTTYLGFSEQKALEDTAAKATEEKKKLEARVAEESSRKVVLRIATGTEDEQDRTELRGAYKANANAILEEHKRLMDKLGGAALPGGRNQFAWPIGSDNEIAPAPTKTIPQIARIWADMHQQAAQQLATERASHQKTQEAKAAADLRAEEQKRTFDQQVAQLAADMKAKTDAMEKAFAALKTEADKKGIDFRKAMDEWANAQAQLTEQINAQKLETQRWQDMERRARTADPSDMLARLRKVDLAKLAERLGTVRSKTTSSVTIRFEQRMHLVPGQTFVVIAAGGSLGEVLEREVELEKRHHEHKSLDAREPFADNERVKGTVEITNVTGTDTATARITYESNPIRNPIAVGDQLFNMTLSSGARETVAYAGIIDLDGDGKHDNDAFVRILEKNNLDIHAYLDLRTGQVKGRGLNPGTRLLIIGSDAPAVGNIKKMMDQAEKLSIPIVDARRFLALIGIKPPRNPAPPAYTNVTLGGEGERAPKDQGDDLLPPVPKVEDKKDEGKKDQ